MKTLQERIDEVIELDKKRTQGKWLADSWEHTHGHTKDDGWYVDCYQKEVFDRDTLIGYARHLEYIEEGDAKFVAHAPEMVALVQDMNSRIKELEEETKRLKDELSN